MTKLLKPPDSGLIKKAVADALSTPVIKFQRIRQGVVNRVYKVEAASKKLILRIFRHKNWPEDGMLEWIEKQLAKHKIPHAKLLYYNRDDRFFPDGFMISEYINGVDGWTAIKKGYHSLPGSWYESGKVLRKIHQIKLKKYGEINYGRGTHKDFINFMLEQVREPLGRLSKANFLSPVIYKDFQRVIKKNLFF